MFTKKIILGSSSPRRRELVEQLGFPTEIRKMEVDEIYPASLELAAIPEYLARLKAEPLKDSIQENEILLTSDTVVILENELIGKPKDRREAIEILKKLSNNSHSVISGVYLFSEKQEISFSVETKVFFSVLTDEEIIYYVDNYKPFDKAGSYGIQEWIGFIGIKKIEGCFYNVMGLPVNKIWEILNTKF